MNTSLKSVTQAWSDAWSTASARRLSMMQLKDFNLEGNLKTKGGIKESEQGELTDRWRPADNTITIIRSFLPAAEETQWIIVNPSDKHQKDIILIKELCNKCSIILLKEEEITMK